MDKVFILGSCVSRDIYRFVTDSDIADYYARTTILSLMSRPLAVGDIPLKSEFQRRTVSKDFSKTFFDAISGTAFGYLLIDFIDERFDILQFKKSYVTRSAEFAKAGLDKAYPFKKVDKETSRYRQEWERNMVLFSQKLLGLVSPQKIILHKAFWSARYWENGSLVEFPNQHEIASNNEILDFYYRTAEKHLCARAVSVKESQGDAAHLWGLSPFHYTEEYYMDIYRQVRSIMGKPESQLPSEKPAEQDPGTATGDQVHDRNVD